MRWVHTVWSVLEQSNTRSGADRPYSLDVNRAGSTFSISDAEGSIANPHKPGPRNTAQPSGARLSPLALWGPSRPLFTTDDAVIETTGGLAAPLVQRGSRRLAIPGLDRARSLRRISSEGDLAGEAKIPRKSASTTDILDIPLTAQAARTRLMSRDFIFARGILPPRLSTPSPPPTYKAQPSSNQSMTGTRVSPQIRSIPPYPSTESIGTTVRPGLIDTPAPQMTPTDIGRLLSSSESAALLITPVLPAAEWRLRTPDIRHASDVVGERQAQGLEPRGQHMEDRGPPRAEEEGLGGIYDITELQETVVTGARSLSYRTAAELVEAATESEQQKARTPISSAQDSESLYASAFPPVSSQESQYDTASLVMSTRDPHLIRYQLYDAAVPSFSEMTEDGASSAEYSRFKLDRYGPLLHSPASSEYSTAPPPPMSRSTSPSSLSFHTGLHYQAETATYISNRDIEDDLIADLERRSTSSSEESLVLRRMPLSKSDYQTAVTHLSSDQLSSPIQLNASLQNTLYETARETVYDTVPSWHTQTIFNSAVADTHQSFRSSNPSRIPIEGLDQSTKSSLQISMAQSAPTSPKIRRIPVPLLPSPSVRSSVGGEAPPPFLKGWDPTSAGDLGREVNRLLVSTTHRPRGERS